MGNRRKVSKKREKKEKQYEIHLYKNCINLVEKVLNQVEGKGKLNCFHVIIRKFSQGAHNSSLH